MSRSDRIGLRGVFDLVGQILHAALAEASVWSKDLLIQSKRQSIGVIVRKVHKGPSGSLVPVVTIHPKPPKPMP